MAVGDVKNDLQLVKDTTVKWTANTAKNVGDLVIPTAGATWWVYECTTAGTTGTTEPVWPTVPGQTVTDGTVVWTCRARYLDIQPPAGEEWVIHNICHGNNVELYFTDGANFIKVDASTGSGAWLGFAFHVTNSRFYRLLNVSGSPAWYGYDGVQTR